MKTLLRILLLTLTTCAYGQVGVDQTKWYAVNNLNEAGAWCAMASQAAANNGILTLTAVHVTTTCRGSTAPYAIGAMLSNFSFTYGRVVVVAKLAPAGLHSTIWFWGGAPSTGGYPPTCIAAIKAGGLMMGGCMDVTANAYEIDMAELMPINGMTIVGNNTHTWVNNSTTANVNTSYNTTVDLSQQFHTYEMNWSSTQLVFKFDGITTNTINLTAGIYDQPMLMILDQEKDVYSGNGTFPLMTQYKSVQIWDQSNNLIFSDFFPGVGGAFWYGIP